LADSPLVDTSSLLVSLLFGLVGTGFFMYGKTDMRLVPMGVGVLLMVCPYFIANMMALLIVCSLLSIVPFVVRDT
jgi:hypothetical protein